MGKSYNRNQDKYNKWDRERQRRDHKKNKFKTNTRNNQLTNIDSGDSLRTSFSDESSY